MSRRFPAALVGALALVLGAGLAEAQVYRWTDDTGVTHLVTDPHRVLHLTPGGPLATEASVNGVPLKLLVDTGASRTVIALELLARAGVDLRSGRPARVAGVGGVVSATEVLVPRLDVAGAQVGPLAVIAHDVPGLSVDGLLGRDVLEHFTLTIDPARGRAILSR